MADSIDTEEGRLAGEASHAAGNLIHRLYYLTDVLAHVPQAGEASEALAQLKDALGELHVLVARSLALLKPVKIKTMEVTAADVAMSVARRLGAEADAVNQSSCAADLHAMPVEVDPTQLDRALRLLVEAFAERVADVDAPLHDIDIELSVGACTFHDRETTEGLVIKCRNARNGTPTRSDANDIAVALAAAVATRVLRTFACDARLDRNDERSVLTIFVPASSRYFLKTTPR
jgi:hypothetical protein